MWKNGDADDSKFLCLLHQVGISNLNDLLPIAQLAMAQKHEQHGFFLRVHGKLGTSCLGSSHLPRGIFVVLYVYFSNTLKPTRLNQTAQRELNLSIFCNRKYMKWYTWSGGSSESNCHIHLITPASKDAFEGLLIGCLWRVTNPPECTAAKT